MPGALVALGVLLALGAIWLAWTANRLDRMHHRIDVGRETLRAQLLRRCGVVIELAATDELDPASRLLLLDAAHQARTAGPLDWEAAESRLSVVLRAVFEGGQPEPEHGAVHPGAAPDRAVDDVDGDGRSLVGELAATCAKVELARRFLNSDVVSARSLRSRRRVRWLHLAGRAAELHTVDLDDRPPATFTA